MQALTLSLTLFGGLLAIILTISAQEAQVDVESLAKLVCQTTRGTKRQISHVSHVAQLVQFLQGVNSEHKLFACRNLYLESLIDLEQVVSEANEDACGEVKIKLIEDFHRKYVSKVSKYVRQQKRGNKAPKMAKMFFMQYASKVSDICEQGAVSILEKNKRPIDHDELSKLNQMKHFTDMLGMSDLSKGYKGTYLFWNMVDSLGLEADKKFARYLDEGPMRLNVQMKEGRSIRGVQAMCQYKLRPFYSRVILPVLRLVDMGYYPESERLLADEPKMRSLYLATQICETLLPLRVFEDQELGGDQLVALERDEAKKLPQPELINETEAEVKIEPLSVAHLDALVEAQEAQAGVEVIKANVASRAKVIGRMLRVAIKQLTERMGSRLGKMLFRRGANKQLESVGGEELKELDDGNHALIQEELDDDDNSYSRVRRSGVLHAISIGLRYIFWIIYAIILIAIKLAILFAPLLLITMSILTFCPEHFKSIMEWGVDIRKSLGLKKEKNEI